MPEGGWREFSGPDSRQRPQPPAATTPRALQKVRVQRTRAGKGGKLVTMITGLEVPEAEGRQLLRRLKTSTGSGGTLKEGVFELQGDHVAAVLAALEQEGYRPKQAGG